MLQDRKLIIHTAPDTNKTTTFRDDETGLTIQCAFQPVKCSPLCAAVELHGTGYQVLCNRNGDKCDFIVGTLKEDQ